MVLAFCGCLAFWAMALGVAFDVPPLMLGGWAGLMLFWGAGVVWDHRAAVREAELSDDEVFAALYPSVGERDR
jgi:hypothetical protein